MDFFRLTEVDRISGVVKGSTDEYSSTDRPRVCTSQRIDTMERV